jgi:hypothetical protein
MNPSPTRPHPSPMGAHQHGDHVRGTKGGDGRSPTYSRLSMDQQLLAAVVAQQGLTQTPTPNSLISPQSDASFNSLGRNGSTGQSLVDAITQATNTAVAMDSLSRSANIMAQDQATLAAALISAATTPPPPAMTNLQEQIQTLHLQQALQTLGMSMEASENQTGQPIQQSHQPAPQPAQQNLQQNLHQQNLQNIQQNQLQNHVDSSSPSGNPIAVSVPLDQTPQEAVEAAFVAIAKAAHAQAQSEIPSSSPIRHDLGTITMPVNTLQNTLLANLGTPGTPVLGTPGLNSNLLQTNVDPLLAVAVAQQQAAQQAHHVAALQQQVNIQQANLNQAQANLQHGTNIQHAALQQQAVQEAMAQQQAVQDVMQQVAQQAQQQAVQQAVQQAAVQQAVQAQLSSGTSPPVQVPMSNMNQMAAESNMSQMIMEHIHSSPAVQQIVHQAVSDVIQASVAVHSTNLLSAALQPAENPVIAALQMDNPTGPSQTHRRTGSLPQVIAAITQMPQVTTFAPALPNLSEKIAEFEEVADSKVRNSKRLREGKRKSSAPVVDEPEEFDSKLMLDAEEEKMMKSGFSSDAPLEGEHLEVVITSLYNILKHKYYLAAGFTYQSDYARERWRLSPERVSQLLACYPILQALAHFPIRPDNEKIYRAIGYYCKKEKEWPELWSKSLELAGDKKLTSGFVVQVFSTMDFVVPAVEYSPPEELVNEMESFLGPSFVAPLWHPSTTVCFVV